MCVDQSKQKLILYCDESVRSGRYYSNFFGGVVAQAAASQVLDAEAKALFQQIGLTGEVKWSSINVSLEERYIEVVDWLFDAIEAERLKMRIMFTQNRDVIRDQDGKSYQKLYYQFIKWSFGIEYCAEGYRSTEVHLRLDRMPARDLEVLEFKNYIESLHFQEMFRRKNVIFNRDWIEEIDSRRHPLAQCTDLVLGAMAFRLNDRHKDKPHGSNRRGKRTRAKERVYKHINQRIRQLYPNFNIGVNTGTVAPEDRWRHPYRHWLFVPRKAERDNSLTKKKAP